MGAGLPNSSIWWVQIGIRSLTRRCTSPLWGTGHRQLVGHTGRLEVQQLEGAHLHRMVDELVVVGGLVAAKAVALRLQLSQGRGHAPAGAVGVAGGLDVDRVQALGLTNHFQEDAGAVEVAVVLVQVGHAHAQVPGVDLVGQLQGALNRRGLPGVLVELVQAHQVLASVARLDLDDVLGELSHQVGARDPGGQPQHLTGGIWVGDLQGDREDVGGGGGGLDRVVNAHAAERSLLCVQGFRLNMEISCASGCGSQHGEWTQVRRKGKRSMKQKKLLLGLALLLSVPSLVLAAGAVRMKQNQAALAQDHLSAKELSGLLAAHDHLSKTLPLWGQGGDYDVGRMVQFGAGPQGPKLPGLGAPMAA